MVVTFILAVVLVMIKITIPVFLAFKYGVLWGILAYLMLHDIKITVQGKDFCV